MQRNPGKFSDFLLYLFKFFGIFAVLYYGTIGFIGLVAAGGHYVAFLDKYFNYVSWLRFSLLQGSRALMSLTDFDTYVKDIYTLQVHSGRGVHVGFDCLGYGVMSFWTAFIIANQGSLKRKLAWVSGGLVMIWCINVARIALLLIAINKKWSSPAGFDHHTWFNIAAYACIFTGIYFYDRSSGRHLKAAHGRS
jgi:exosortase/archaeosortase family protein